MPEQPGDLLLELGDHAAVAVAVDRRVGRDGGQQVGGPDRTVAGQAPAAASPAGRSRSSTVQSMPGRISPATTRARQRFLQEAHGLRADAVQGQERRRRHAVELLEVVVAGGLERPRRRGADRRQRAGHATPARRSHSLSSASCRPASRSRPGRGGRRSFQYGACSSGASVQHQASVSAPSSTSPGAPTLAELGPHPARVDGRRGQAEPAAPADGEGDVARLAVGVRLPRLAAAAERRRLGPPGGRHARSPATAGGRRGARPGGTSAGAAPGRSRRRSSRSRPR